MSYLNPQDRIEALEVLTRIVVSIESTSNGSSASLAILKQVKKEVDLIKTGRDKSSSNL